MKVTVRKIDREMDEQVIVRSYDVNEDVKSIIRFVKSAGATLAGYIEKRASQIALRDILYVKAVDNKALPIPQKRPMSSNASCMSLKRHVKAGNFSGAQNPS